MSVQVYNTEGDGDDVWGQSEVPVAWVRQKHDTALQLVGVVGNVLSVKTKEDRVGFGGGAM